MNLFMVLRIVTSLSMACFLSGIAVAQSKAGDFRAGERLALANCSRCHSVGSAGASPLLQAPAFRFIAKKYKLEDLEEAFAEGILTGHNAMPEFVLTPDQISNLTAYLQQLRDH